MFSGVNFSYKVKQIKLKKLNFDPYEEEKKELKYDMIGLNN